MNSLKKCPLVSIVVLNWNRLEDTKLCIGSLRDLDYPNLELIIVDNGSVDGSKEYLKKLDNIIYVDNPTNRGFTGGHIDGLKHCSGEFIILLNNDALISRDYVSIALDHFTDNQVGAVGGRSYWWNDDNPPYDERNLFFTYQEIDVYTAEAHMLSNDNAIFQEVNNLSGSCVVLRKSMIDKIGYLYDEFFAYFEETDLFARAKRANYKVIYDPKLKIWHRNGATSDSSSGSYFFFYQIFRNRFIFATRNFEGKFLIKFWIIYSRIVMRSFLRFIFRKNDPIMNKAYLKAGVANFFLLPKTFFSRLQLRYKLGKSGYNHTIFSEQIGISVVIDATKLSQEKLDKIINKLKSDKNNTQCEYVFVLSKTLNLNLNDKNIRSITNKGYFTTQPINLGCLITRFPWILLCEPDKIPTIDGFHKTIVEYLDKDIDLIIFGNKRSLSRSRNVLLLKSFYERVGGIENQGILQNRLSNLIEYAKKSKKLAWCTIEPNTSMVNMPKLSHKQSTQILRMIAFDNSLIKANKVGFFSKINNKYYRVFQVNIFIHWIFIAHIPIHLKLARIKNLIIFTLSLNLRQLRLEFKHIKNEVILNSGRWRTVKYEHKITRNRIQESMLKPKDLTVFIICYERLEGLKLLIKWLETQGIHKIVLIDNNSTYLPLLKFYKKTPYQVLELRQNIGHTSPWSLSIIRALVPKDFYIVTDPDIIPDENCPPDFLTYFLKIHKEFFAYKKVGFGLEINDLPDYYPLKQQVIEWESQFWTQKLGDDLYEAGIDTTFALYKPFTYTYMLHPSIRTGYPYVARHLPWYTNPTSINKEEVYYRSKVNRNINSWNSDEIADRYHKEMNKKL